jgi:hypothetical protein
MNGPGNFIFQRVALLVAAFVAMVASLGCAASSDYMFYCGR